MFQSPSETSDIILNYAVTWPISEVELNDGFALGKAEGVIDGFNEDDIVGVVDVDNEGLSDGDDDVILALGKVEGFNEGDIVGVIGLDGDAEGSPSISSGFCL